MLNSFLKSDIESLGRETHYDHRVFIEYPSKPPFTIVTGLGLHSHVRHRLKPAIVNALRNNSDSIQWLFEIQTSSILVTGCNSKK
jgi:hypothetical protein